MNQSILYWKWEKSVLGGGRYRAELQSMLRRSSFKYLYISFHHFGVPYNDPALHAALSEVCRILRAAGRSLILDIDARNEFLAFRKFGGEESARIAFLEGRLDAFGKAAFTQPDLQCGRVGRGMARVAPSELLGAWCFSETEEKAVLAESVCGLAADYVSEGGVTRFSLDGGPMNGGKSYLLAVLYPARLPDIFGTKIYSFYEAMFSFYADLPLGGVATDEWGHDLVLEYEDATGLFSTKMFPYTENFEKRFRARYGRPLRDDLLYFARFVQGKEGETYRVVDQYLECLRSFMRDNNDWFYEEGKRRFGKDAFIGVHCTFWGDPYDFGIDILHNGIDWWEVRRDHAQTDEFCIFPIRLALMHKWNSPFWYNMWYSGNTQQLHTYYEETWRNILYGGRTDYLGYECVNEPGVFKLRNEGALEQIERMERAVSRIDDCVHSQPASSLLIVFGIESVSNWMVSYGRAEIVRGRGALQDVLRYANGVFKGCNCDLVPSSEIVNGSLRSEGGKLVYGSQRYDAAVFVSPEGADARVFAFFERYLREGGLLALSGTCRRLADGSDARQAFAPVAAAADLYSEGYFTAKQTLDWLASRGVPTNRVCSGCVVYADGTVVAADENAFLADGNFLERSFLYEGHFVTFRGNDFLVLNFRTGVCAYGEGSELRIDGALVTEEEFAARFAPEKEQAAV